MSLESLFAAGYRRRELIAHTTRAIGMAAVYVVAAYVGLSLRVTNGAASVWPASGVLFAVLLLTPPRFTRSILIGALAGGGRSESHCRLRPGNQHRIHLHQSW